MPELSRPPDAAVPAIAAADVPVDAYVVDVREPHEWVAGHIDGAHPIPLAALPERLAELPRDRTVVVACRSGGRSARAVRFLTEQGVQAVNLEGGTQAWAALSRPMSSESDGAPSVV